MKNRIAILISSALLLPLLIGLMQASPAKAVEPIPFGESGEFEYPYDCGEFTIWEKGSFYGEGRTYLDQDGHKIRSWVKETITDGYSREGSNLELSGSSTMSGFYYYNEQGEITLARAEGTYFVIRVPVPGYGLILRNVGLILADYEKDTLVIQGNWDWYEEDGMEAVCAYFADQ